LQGPDLFYASSNVDNIQTKQIYCNKLLLFSSLFYSLLTDAGYVLDLKFLKPA